MTDHYVTRTRQLSRAAVDDLFTRLVRDPDRPDRTSERSWWRSIEEIRDADDDRKATNPNAPGTTDKRSVEEPRQIIRDSQGEIAEALKLLNA